MHVLMLAFISVYIFFVLSVIRRVVRFMSAALARDEQEAQQVFEGNLLRKQRLSEQTRALEEDANKIFVLYKVTREISKNFDEEQALQVFRAHLAQNVAFEECRLLEPLTAEEKEEDDPTLLRLELKGKRKILGHLVLKGVHYEDREKVTIMANQLAMALHRIRLYQQIEHLAITDALTETHTRRYIFGRLEEELARAQARKMNLSLLLIDADHFKKFNDQHGHLTGDQILRGIAKMIRERIREIDIAGRFGGEEFLVILPDTDTTGAQYVAERIRAEVERTPIKAYDAAVKATVSVGIASYPSDGELSAELVDKADWALYRAKKDGRNKVCAFGVYREGHGKDPRPRRP